MAVESEFSQAAYILTREPPILTNEPMSAREIESGQAIRTLHIIMTGAPAASIAAARAAVLQLCQDLVVILTV